MTAFDDACEHALEAYPCEACGLISIVKGRERYSRCRNIADNAEAHFVMAPSDYAAVEALGEIIAVVHSHPNTGAQPSEADKVLCEASGLPWHILAVHADTGTPRIAATCSFEPTGYEAPLVGRQFHHGVLDCYALIQDWYARERGIVLPHFDRPDDWWHKGGDLYMQNFAAAGFARCNPPLQEGDVILMQVRAPVANHAAVYLDGGHILHHLFGRLSSRDVYGGQWQEMTRAVVRYVG